MSKSSSAMSPASAREPRPFVLYGEVVFLGMNTLLAYNALIPAYVAFSSPGNNYVDSPFFAKAWTSIYAICGVSVFFLNLFNLIRLPWFVKLATGVVLTLVSLVMSTGVIFTTTPASTEKAILAFASVFLVGVGGGLLGSCVFALAGAVRAPGAFVCVMVGQGIGGLVVGLLSNVSAKWTLVSAIAMIVLTIPVALMTGKNAIGRHALAVVQGLPVEGEEAVGDAEAPAPSPVSEVEERSLFAFLKTVFLPAYSVFLVFYVTFCIFPVASTTPSISWPVVNPLFLFMVGDLVSRVACTLFPLSHKLANSVLVTARLAFVPLYIWMCLDLNEHKEQDTWFRSNGFRMAMMLAMALSNGFLSTAALNTARRADHSPKELAMVGNIVGVSLQLGILLGCFTSFGINAFIAPPAAVVAALAEVTM